MKACSRGIDRAFWSPRTATVVAFLVANTCAPSPASDVADAAPQTESAVFGSVYRFCATDAGAVLATQVDADDSPGVKIQCSTHNDAEVLRLQSTPWVRGLFLVVQVREADNYRYVGVALPRFGGESSLDLTKPRIGTLFHSNAEFDLIQVTNFRGDSIAATFGVTRLLPGGSVLADGVMLIHDCPETPSPGNLFRLTGTKVYCESDVIETKGLDAVKPPHIQLNVGRQPKRPNE